MSATDPHLIDTPARLREVIGDCPERLREKVRYRLDEFAETYIALSPFLILSTADAEGNVDASPKGDAPGFVTIADDQTLLIPDRPGNRLAFGHENVLANSRVGLLFMIPGTRETLRINGTAELTADPSLLERHAARGKPATLIIRVHVEEYFFHCAKAFIRADLWNPDSWGEPHKVSFGEMFRKWNSTDEASARGLDEAIQADYEHNL